MVPVKIRFSLLDDETNISLSLLVNFHKCSHWDRKPIIDKSINLKRIASQMLKNFNPRILDIVFLNLTLGYWKHTLSFSAKQTDL